MHNPVPCTPKFILRSAVSISRGDCHRTCYLHQQVVEAQLDFACLRLFAKASTGAHAMVAEDLRPDLQGL